VTKNPSLTDQDVTELAEKASFKMNVKEFDTENITERINTDSLNTAQKNVLGEFIDDVFCAVSVTMTLNGTDFPVVLKTPFGTFYSAIPSVGEDTSNPISQELYMAIAQMTINDDDGKLGSWSNATPDVYESLDKYEKNVFHAIRMSLCEMHLGIPQLAFIERAKRMETGVELVRRI